MAICIEMKKFKQVNDIIYYHVSTNDFGGADFYVGIDIKNKKIMFYATSNFESILGEYDINDPLNYLEILPLNKKVLPYVILQIKKSFKNNSFYEHIGYAA